MKKTGYLILNKNGIVRSTKNRPGLDWNEICCKVTIDIPDELFKRPTLEAVLKITDVPNTVYNPELIINTKELIEQQTGAKIDFKIVPYE